MTEKELINSLKELKEIKPRKDWVVLTKNRILAEEQPEMEPGFTPLFSAFRYKLALAPLLGVFVVIGLFGFAQSTIPGDFFFSFKKITETAQVNLSSVAEKPKVQLQLANKRLEELSRIAENNQVRNLGPAIEEFQASVTQAAKDLASMEAGVDNSDSVVLKELVEETRKLSENKEKVESVLGTKVGDMGELENAMGALEQRTAGYLIADLETRTLSEESQSLLEEAKAEYEEGKYQEALYKLWQVYNH